MSDFDKEAERERLREKYEHDKEKRETTERMSELLLKGATMTDVHCENCGDPVFRYEGEEFCPTCQQLVTSDDEADDAGHGEVEESDARHGEAGDSDARHGEAGDSDAGHGEAGDSDAGHGEGESGSLESVEGPGPTGRTADDPDATGTESAPGGPASGYRDRAEPDATGSTAGRRPTAGRPATSAPSISPEATTGDEQSGDAVEQARASLRQALRFHAGRAAETADPRRARDHLAAAREAAEALSALY